MKPTQSIKEHCKWWCMNDAYGVSKCVTPDCKLRQKIPALKRIKDWCKECALDFEPWKCTGEVLNTEYTKKHKCPLHTYRMGRNKSLNHSRKPVHLAKYAFKSGASDSHNQIKE